LRHSVAKQSMRRIMSAKTNSATSGNHRNFIYSPGALDVDSGAMSILFSTVKWALIVVFVGGFFLSMTSEAFRFIRARYNTQGTIVHGFTLYEKNLPI